MKNAANNNTKAADMNKLIQKAQKNTTRFNSWRIKCAAATRLRVAIETHSGFLAIKTARINYDNATKAFRAFANGR